MAGGPTLPVITLKDTAVPAAVLTRIALDTMKRFQVVAFEETANELKLAIVYPEQLKQGFFTAIKDMESKVGRKITLYKTDPQSFAGLLKQYPAPTPSVQPETGGSPTTSVEAEAPAQAPKPAPKQQGGTVPPPPLFKLGQTVALNYLKRVPIGYGKDHRLVSVDFFPPSTYWFLTDGSRGEETTHLVKEIEKSNGITIHLITVKVEELDDLLVYYEGKLAEEEVELEKKKLQSQQAPKGPATMSVEPEKKLAEGVTVPDVQATILSTEAEKGGIAGLFQRVAQSLGAPKAEGEEVAATEEAPPASTAAPAPSPTTEGIPAATPEGTPPAEMAVTATEGVKKQTTARTDDEEGDIGKLLEGQVNSVDELKEHIRKGFIPRIVAAVVSYAIHEKASDIHIEAFDDEVRIRYRVDGQLLDIVKLPPDVHAAMVSRIKILSRLRLDETRVPQDGRFDVAFNHAQVDLRVSVMPTVHGEKVVMRILDKARGITSLEKLGIEGLGYQNLMAAIQKPFGVCLATGPTGSGKSTTLYAILNRIATPNVNVITLEDPVEYEMKGINQSQIRPKIGFTFAEGLRSVLRQDPNIIMVGEIRDGETANMSTQAALTGHLVLSTLHTNDAAGAIPRLTNMGIEPFLITSSLNVALGQRLVRKICTNCRKEVALPPGFKAEIEEDIAALGKINPLDAVRLPKEIKFYQGQGCEKCGGKGYQGRMGIYEVLVMSEAVEELTLKHAPNAEIQAQAQKDGMLTMYQDGLIKVVNGITTLDEVLRETTTK